MILTVTKIVNDLERDRRRDEEGRVQGGAGARQRPAHAACATTTSCARRASAPRMLQLALDAFARLDVNAAARGDRPRRRDRRRVLRDPAPADQLHDGRPAHDHARRSRSCSSRSRSSASATTRRTSPRPSCRWSRAGRAPRVGRADPRRVAAAVMPYDPRSSRTSRRSSSCSRSTCVDAGYEVQAAADAETAQVLLNASRCRTCCCSTGCCPGNRASRSRSSCAPTRARKELPVIMVTARTDEADTRRRPRGVGRRLRDQAVLAARAQGADQVGAAPACARGGAGAAAGGLAQARPVDAPRHRRRRDRCTLGPTEFRLLRFFLARPERVHTRAQLLDQVWGDHVYIEERTVDVHIRRLRLALEPFGQDRADRDGARQRLPARGAALTPANARCPGHGSQVVLAPVVVAGSRPLAWAWSPGAGVAAQRRCRHGAGARSRLSPLSSRAPARWARAPLDDARCPRAAAVGAARSRRSTSACARARAMQRDLAHTDRAFPECRGSDPRRHGRARHARIASSGRTLRAQRAARSRSRHATSAHRW